MTPLHLVYRSSSGDGADKPRPAYFSKAIALESFCRAVEATRPSSVTWVNDGSILPERVNLMREYGPIEELPSVGNARSFRVALSLVDRSPWADDDIVYFSEDDYLYLENAFIALDKAAESIEEASLFTLYDHPDYYQLKVHRGGHLGERVWTIDGTQWRPVRSTCMTFASRVGLVRRLHFIFSYAAKGTVPNDFGLFSALTGAPGYRWLGRVAGAKSCRDRDFAARALLGRSRATILVAPRPSLATHMHEPYITRDHDWGAIAEKCAARTLPT